MTHHGDLFIGFPEAKFCDACAWIFQGDWSGAKLLTRPGAFGHGRTNQRIQFMVHVLPEQDTAGRFQEATDHVITVMDAVSAVNHAQFKHAVHAKTAPFPDFLEGVFRLDEQAPNPRCSVMHGVAQGLRLVPIGQVHQVRR